MSNEYDSYYDSETNNKNNYYSELTTRGEHDIGLKDLLKSLELDKDFIDYYYSFKEQDNLLLDFSNLPDVIKLEILIKIFFYVHIS